MHTQNTDNPLVEIFYNRRGGDDIKSAVVTERQADDIKFLLPHIHIIESRPASYGSKRDYILM